MEKEKIVVLQMGNDITIPSNGMITVMKMICHSPEVNNAFDIKTVFFSFPTMGKMTKVLGAVRSIVQFFRVIINVDVIHIHHSTGLNLLLTMFFTFFGSLFKKKVILHNHAGDFREYYAAQGSIRKYLIKKTYERTDATITLTQFWKKWHYENISRKTNWIVMPNPTPLPQPAQPNYSSDDRISMLYMSRLQERKGVYDLLDVIPGIVDRFPGVMFLLAGDGDIEEVSVIVRNTGLDNNVKILGWIGDAEKVDILKKVALFVMPSYHEGLPMALLETMSFGIPCIATAVGGIPELIKDGENGILIEPGDKSQLSEAIVSLVSNKKLRDEIGLAAFNTIRQSYSLDKYLSRLKHLYTELANTA